MALSENEKAQLLGRHLHDQANAAAEQAVRENAKNIGLSRRETERRLASVRSRFR